MKDHIVHSSGPFSRRKFLRFVAAGAACAVGAALDPVHASAKGETAIPAKTFWKPSTFATRTGETFEVDGGTAGILRMKLIRLQYGAAKIYRWPRKSAPAPKEDCYLLVFRGPRDPMLAQNTYEFDHPELGTFSLFIVPGKATSAGQNYEAVVNHVHA